VTPIDGRYDRLKRRHRVRCEKKKDLRYGINGTYRIMNRIPRSSGTLKRDKAQDLKVSVIQPPPSQDLASAGMCVDEHYTVPKQVSLFLKLCLRQEIVDVGLVIAITRLIQNFSDN
jgi:hypothetical protein